LEKLLKKIDKLRDWKLFSKYPSVDWKEIKRIRDIIRHHYFDIDAEIIYEVCKNKIPELKDTKEEILKDI